jgi:hypothetical protein
VSGQSFQYYLHISGDFVWHRYALVSEAGHQISCHIMQWGQRRIETRSVVSTPFYSMQSNYSMVQIILALMMIVQLQWQKLIAMTIILLLVASLMTRISPSSYIYMQYDKCDPHSI